MLLICRNFIPSYRVLGHTIDLGDAIYFKELLRNMTTVLFKPFVLNFEVNEKL